MKFENCSVYFKGMIGYVMFECKWVEIEVKPYAQYPSAIHVTFLRKRKRKPEGFVQGYRPNVVVASGHGLPSPDDGIVPVSSNGQVSVSRSRYSSCDPQWDADFQSQVVPKLEVLFNGHGFNTLVAA